MKAKEIAIKILRWIAVPVAYMIAIVLGVYLGKIIFNFTFADNGLFLFKNAKVQSAISDLITLLSQALGVNIGMLVAGLVAPSHKIGTARTVGGVHCAIVLICFIIALALGMSVSLSEIAGVIGIALGAIVGWGSLDDILSN